MKIRAGLARSPKCTKNTIPLPAIPDVDRIKTAAFGQWNWLLQEIGGVPPELLDGKHRPCPKCGGDDRFRLLDETEGAVFCNRCFSERNGDGISALQWLTGRSFPETLALLAGKLGVELAGNFQLRRKSPLERLHTQARKRAERRPPDPALAGFWTLCTNALRNETLLGLPCYQRAWSYLAHRGLTEAALELGLIGMLPLSGSLPASVRGWASQDRWLVSPLYDCVTGELRSFQGRTVDQANDRKVVSATGVPISGAVMANGPALELIRGELDAETVVLVEGDMDFLSMALVFEGPVIGVPGTTMAAGCVAEWAHGRHILLAFDPDEAGEQAAESVAEIAAEHGARCGQFIDETPARERLRDVNDVLREDGQEALRCVVKKHSDSPPISAPNRAIFRGKFEALASSFLVELGIAGRDQKSRTGDLLRECVDAVRQRRHLSKKKEEVDDAVAAHPPRELIEWYEKRRRELCPVLAFEACGARLAVCKDEEDESFMNVRIKQANCRRWRCSYCGSWLKASYHSLIASTLEEEPELWLGFVRDKLWDGKPGKRFRKSLQSDKPRARRKGKKRTRVLYRAFRVQGCVAVLCQKELPEWLGSVAEPAEPSCSMTSWSLPKNVRAAALAEILVDLRPELEKGQKAHSGSREWGISPNVGKSGHLLGITKKSMTTLYERAKVSALVKNVETVPGSTHPSRPDQFERLDAELVHPDEIEKPKTQEQTG